MLHRRIASEPEVVLAFLRGELDSERFGPDVRRSLVDAGGLELVLRPDLASEQENLSRERALRAARGWRAGTGLFAGFPDRVDWSHGEFEPDEPRGFASSTTPTGTSSPEAHADPAMCCPPCAGNA